MTEDKELVDATGDRGSDTISTPSIWLLKTFA